MFISFIGVIIITFGDKDSTSTDQTEVPASISNRVLGIVLILIAAWFVAGMLTSNRLLKGIDPFIVMFWHGFFGLIMAIVYVVYDEVVGNEEPFNFLTYTPLVNFILLISCIGDFIAILATLKAS